MTDEYDGLFDEDVAEKPLPASLAEVAKLMKELEHREAILEAAEQRVKEERLAVQKLTYGDLPALFQELQLTGFTTEDGRTVKLKTFTKGSIPADSKDAAHAWMEENGFGDLIKHELSVKLPKGETDAALEIVDAAAKLGISMKDNLRVHPSTLNSFLGSCDEEGISLPDDLFKVHRGSYVKV